MKKILLGIALISVVSLGASKVNAAEIDLDNFGGYQNTCAEGSVCNGELFTVIGNHLYQLNNNKVKLQPMYYAKAQTEYGISHMGEVMPIFYIGGPMGNRTVKREDPDTILEKKEYLDTSISQINGKNYTITKIDGESINVENIDTLNDGRINQYETELGSVLPTYTNGEGKQILKTVSYDEEKNTVTFTVNKDGLNESLKDFLEVTDIDELFSTFSTDATTLTYTVKGDYSDAVTKEVEEGTDPVALARELLLSIARENGVDKTAASSLTYKDVENSSAKVRVTYVTEGLTQVVEYTLEFVTDLTKEEATNLTKENNDEVLNSYKESVSSSLESYDALESVTFEDEKLTFNVNDSGLENSLVEMLELGGIDKNTITEVFKEVTKGATKAEYTIGGQSYTVTNFTDVVTLAKDLLLKLAQNNGVNKTNASSLIYADVVGNDGGSTVTITVTYDVNGYDNADGPVTIEYTLEFLGNALKEVKEAENDAKITEKITEVNDAITVQEISEVKYDEDTNTVEFVVADTTGVIAEFMDEENLEDSPLLNIFNTLTEGTSKIELQINGTNLTFNKDDYADANHVYKMAARIIASMKNNAAVTGRLDVDELSTMTYQEIINRNASILLYYGESGSEYSVSYSLLFSNN